MINNILWILGFILVLALSRIIPHPPNFTPILAVAIFAPMIIKNIHLVVATVLGAMLIADFYWGLHQYMLWTYGAIACSTLLATKIKLLPMMFISPVLFFIITNFAVWTTGYYGFTYAGLLACYTAAIPFFGMTLLSSICYTTAFYVLYRITQPLKVHT